MNNLKMNNYLILIYILNIVYSIIIALGWFFFNKSWQKLSNKQYESSNYYKINAHICFSIFLLLAFITSMILFGLH